MYSIHNNNVEIGPTTIKEYGGYFVIGSQKGNCIQVNVTGYCFDTDRAFGHKFGKVTDHIKHGLFVELSVGCEQ